MAILLFMVIVSGFGDNVSKSNAPFFSNEYRPSGALNFLMWRALAVPVFTSADALECFVVKLDSVHLMGATSSLTAALFGLERVNFERLVFEYQWGQTETGTGSANAVFFIDAYINFGWPGVVFFSAIVGVLFRMIAKSSDQALQAVWPLFAFGLYVSGLVGNLFSSGFLLVFLLSGATRIRSIKRVSSQSRETQIKVFRSADSIAS